MAPLLTPDQPRLLPHRPRLTISNVRLGLATNSSSSHSIVLMPPDHAPGTDYAPDPDGYGDTRWVLYSQQAKADYLATLIYLSLREIAPEAIAMTVADAWAGGRPREGGIAGLGRLTLPREWHGHGLDPAFAHELATFLQMPDVAVMSVPESDPYDDVEPAHRGDPVYIPRDLETGDWVARKEPTGHWILFNRDTGTRLTCAFDPHLPNLTKTSAPLLVDLKLTDACPFRCAFCYQGSTVGGAVGDPAFLDATIEALGAMRVFEVAIGGGEPTLDPRFLSTLQRLRANGVVPSFTTKSLGWLRDPAQRDPIFEAAGAFAYSVETADDVRELAALLPARSIGAARIATERVREQAVVQVVLGVTPLETVRDILIAAEQVKLRVTLLGYKRTGRGAAFPPVPYHNWMAVVRALQGTKQMPDFAIDTALAAESRDTLERAGIPSWSYQVQEGGVSMYIDAVTQRIGPSSYGTPETMVPTTAADLESAIATHFPRWARPSRIHNGDDFE